MELQGINKKWDVVARQLKVQKKKDYEGIAGINKSIKGGKKIWPQPIGDIGREVQE